MGDNFFLIANQLSRYHDVSVITNANVPNEKIKTNDILKIKFNRKSPLDFVNFKSYKSIYHYLKKCDYDIAFILSPHPVNLVVNRFLNKECIITYIHDHILHSGISSFDSFFMNRVLRQAYRLSKAIVVSCDFIRSDIVRNGLYKMPEDIYVNYLGMLENFKYELIDCKQDIDVLFFGRIELYKGLDTLLDCAKMMPDASFVIIGKGDLSEIFKVNALPPNVKHINLYVPDNEIAEYVQRSKVVVLPYRDATGTQVIQTVYYYSRPIVATNVGCFPEYITDGEDGYIIEPNSPCQLKNKLEILLSNSDLRYKFGENGKKKLNTIFNNELLSKELSQYFESFLSRNK